MVAVDYREVNTQLEKVDNLWDYYQLCLTEDSSKVTAIITPCGVTDFLRAHLVYKRHLVSIKLTWNTKFQNIIT